MSALRGIADQLVAALRPLEQALGDPGNFRALLLRLGWRATVIPPEWAALGTSVTALETAVAALVDDPQLEDVIDAVTAARDLRTHLGALTTAPPGVDRDALLGELRELLVERLIIDQLSRGAPRTFGMLMLFGLIRVERQVATAERPAHTRYRIDTSKLTAVIHDPKSLPQILYDVGTANFDDELVTELLFDLVIRLGLPARLERTLGTFPGYPSLLAGTGAIRMPLLDTVLAGNAFRLGVGIAVLPPTAGGPGLVIALEVPGLTEPLQLGPRLALQAVTGANAPIELALVATPAGLDIKFPGEGGALPAGGLGIEAVITAPVTLGSATGSRFELGGATFGVYADHDDDGYFARIAVKVNAAQVVIAAGDQDSIVAKLIGDRELRTPFPFGLQWSSRNGFELTIGPGTLGIPGSLSVGPVRFDNLALSLTAGDHDIEATVSSRVSTSIGPVAINLDRLGGRVKVDRSQEGTFGLGSLDAGVVLPTGAGIVIATSIVTGGGQISRDPATGRYSGALELAMFGYQALGAAVLDTRTPEGHSLVSFVALAAVRMPGIPITLGFFLDGLGGLFGLHRRADDQRIRDAVRAGKIADLLLPDDPKLGLSNLLVQLGSLFPIAEGRFVTGPSVRIGWGTPRSLTADVMVLVEGPSPLRLLILASAALGLPTLDKRVIDIRVDAVGIIDLDRGTVAIDASLHDSKIAGYALGGDLALRANVFSPRSLLLSIGGFHPRFTAPPGFPALRRVELVAGDNPQLRMSAYLAKTPNSVQIGAQVDLKATGGGFDIKAHLGFDALFEIHPFHFDVDIAASADVSWHGHHLLGLDLAFSLTGPHPYHAKGSASFSILWWDVSVGFDHTWGDDSPEPLPPPPDLGQILRDALGGDDAWTAELPAGEPSWLSLRSGLAHVVHPFAALVVVERALPLDHDITMYSGAPVGTQRFSIAHATLAVGATTTNVTARPIEDSFAPGQFTQLSQDEQLAAPSFEDFHAGVRLADNLVHTGTTSHVSLEVDTIEIDPLAPPPAVVRPPFVVTGVFAAFANVVRPTRDPQPVRVVTPQLHDLAFTLASTTTLASTGTTGTYAAMRDALRSAPAGLQIVPKPHAS